MDTDDATTQTMPIETVELMGHLMTASHAQTMSIMDQLHVAALDDVVRLCDVIIEVRQTLDEATVIDRQTEGRLNTFYWQSVGAVTTRDHARRMLEKITGEDHGADAT